MRCVIRRSVFETNSSSLHALCVSKDATDVPSGRKCIRFGTGEYDKCWDILRTPSEKADYLFTMICMGDDAIREKRKGAVRKILGDVGMECKFKDPKEFKDESGCIYYKHCYINQPFEIDEILDKLLSSSEEVLSLLFNKDSFIVIGDDGSDMCYDKIEESKDDHIIYTKYS